MITSKQNPSFKTWMKLKQKKYRDQLGLFLVYGDHLVDEAKKHHCIKEIITINKEIEGTLVSEELMSLLSQTETTFEVMAVVFKKNEIKKSHRVLILEDVRDPDNVGALLRSALAFGFYHVILSPKSADFYNEKVIRASQGALFGIYMERKPIHQAVKDLKAKDFTIFYADAHKGHSKKQAQRIAIILGHEGKGVSQEIKNLSDDSLHIETRHVESLNVSVAGAILMHEWRAFK